MKGREPSAQGSRTKWQWGKWISSFPLPVAAGSGGQEPNVGFCFLPTPRLVTIRVDAAAGVRWRWGRGQDRKGMKMAGGTTMR